jgi:outer membrane lipopolysaccharide assembly protein LptE/RlpB
MTRRLLTISVLLLLALAVSGCTNCGWILQDWTDAPKSCRDRVPDEK